MQWVEYGYPRLPNMIWNHKKYFIQIFSKLVYNPFIETWGQPPDDFWVKLSHYLESENEDMVLRGLILIFNSQGRIFPSPSLYIYKNDPDPRSLILSPEFWE